MADKANDRASHAYTVGVVSYIHLHGGNGKGALRVLGTAQELAARGGPAAVTSWLAEAVGEAHGLAGEPRRGVTALAEAERAFDGVSVDNTPAWLGFFNADCHAARLKGRCLMRLRRPRQAVGALYEALTPLPHFVRERSGTLIDLALCTSRCARSSMPATSPPRPTSWPAGPARNATANGRGNCCAS